MRAVGLVFVLVAAAAVEGSLLVRTQEGWLQGVSLKLPNASVASCDAFLGIPYAESTAGPLRWTPSVAKKPWSGTRSAATFGPGCPQNCLLPPGTCPQSQSEDCLSLNVYAPAGPRANLSVLFFVPGGRFEQGASDTYLYDGRFLVQSDMIVVTINYRLGALGFLYVEGQAEGNFGVQDQIVALQWVQRNIAAFGGDPTKVTIDGQSAGGASATYHMLNSGSKGLFRRAIIQSNPITIPWKEKKDGQQLGHLFAKKLNCTALKNSNYLKISKNLKNSNDLEETDLKCIRGASVAQLLEAQHLSQQHFNPFRPLDVFLPWTPMVGTGGSALPDQPLKMITEKNVPNSVPVITGVVANETMIFVYQGLGANPSKDLYDAFVIDVFGIHANRVFAEYPATENNRTVLHTLSLLGTDYIMACPTRVVASSLPESYLYYFDHVMSFSSAAWGPNYTECLGLVCHGEELPFLFGSANLVIQNAFTNAEKKLVSSMQNAWRSFVLSDATPWKPFSNSSQASMIFSAPISQIAPFPRPEKCAFFDSIGYGRGGRFVAKLAALSRPT